MYRSVRSSHGDGELSLDGKVDQMWRQDQTYGCLVPQWTSWQQRQEIMHRSRVFEFTIFSNGDGGYQLLLGKFDSHSRSHSPRLKSLFF